MKQNPISKLKFSVVLGALLVGGLFVYFMALKNSDSELATKSLEIPENLNLAQNIANIPNGKTLLNSIQSKTQGVDASKNPSESLSNDSIENRSENLKEIRKLSLQVGQVDEHPDETERKLALMAAKLSAAEIESLQKAALSPREEGDYRSLSVYLLTKAQGPLAQEALKNISLSEVSPLDSGSGKSKDDHTMMFESTIRVFAVEGIQNQEDKKAARGLLKIVLDKTTDSVVQDRAQRGLMFLDGKAPDIESQEVNALRKVTR